MGNFIPSNLETLFAIGGVIFAATYFFTQFRSGGKKASDDLITQLQEQLKAQQEINASLKEAHMHQLSQLQEQMKAQQGQINVLTKEVGILQGEKNANTQKIKEYLEMIANRNPELEKTLLALEEFIRQVLPMINDVRNGNAAIRKGLNIHLPGDPEPDEHTTTTNTTSTTVDHPKRKKQ